MLNTNVWEDLLQCHYPTLNRDENILNVILFFDKISLFSASYALNFMHALFQKLFNLNTENGNLALRLHDYIE